MNTSAYFNNKFLNPDEILGQCDVEQGLVAADFGSGPGFFTLPLAKLVGKFGKVYSFDVLPQANEVVESKAKLAGLENITTKRVNLEKESATGLGPNSVNFVVMKDMLFQNKNKKQVLGEAFRVLKPGGKAVIVEWNDSDYSIGPDRDLRINPNDLKELISNVGFKVSKEVHAGKFHYALLIVK